jgi:hypothetical protein
MDRLPDLNSLGLLNHYLRHSDDFDFDLKRFLRGKPGIGEKAGYKARTTLIAYGYLVQIKFRHSYRGRFFTEVYRSAEPHTDAELAELVDRYTPGRQVVIPVEHDDAGRPVEQVVTITWAEMTSYRGVELVTDSGECIPEPEKPKRGTRAKAQVTPDRAFPGTGEPGTGRPGTGVPGPGESGSLKETKEEPQQEQEPSGRQATSPTYAAPPAAAPACLPEVAQPEPETDGAALLRRLPPRLATPQVIRQHHQRITELLAVWSADALYRRLVLECDGNTGPGRLVQAIRDIPAEPPRKKAAPSAAATTTAKAAVGTLSAEALAAKGVPAQFMPSRITGQPSKRSKAQFRPYSADEALGGATPASA